jgi:predicted lipoprotein with Yx(FWY)xxD motif
MRHGSRALQHGKPHKGRAEGAAKKGELTMRSRIVVVFAGILVLMAVVASLSIGAAVKQYQATGAVTDVDAKGKTLSVDKGGEIWQFSTEGLKDMKAKKGDKVTVYYQMIAKKVEMK